MTNDLLISPSEVNKVHNEDDEKEKEDGKDPNADVTDGDKGKGMRRGQLNPVEEESREEQSTPTRSSREEKETDEMDDGLRPGVAADDEAGEAGREEEGEEGRAAVAAPAPMAPSRLEKEAHDLTHTPYRAWCPHCVRMRGRNTAHKKQVRKEKSWVPRISFDYFFFSQEDEQANKHPMIVMVDDETGEKYARGVSQKGLGEDGK